MSARIYLMKTVNGCKDVCKMSFQVQLVHPYAVKTVTNKL